jgi:hypothetical protein
MVGEKQYIRNRGTTAHSDPNTAVRGTVLEPHNGWYSMYAPAISTPYHKCLQELTQTYAHMYAYTLHQQGAQPFPVKILEIQPNHLSFPR